MLTAIQIAEVNASVYLLAAIFVALKLGRKGGRGPWSMV